MRGKPHACADRGRRQGLRLIVDEDADLTNAAEAALSGGMSNAGQTCIGTEQITSEKVFDSFNEITSQAKDLHAGPDGKIGPITMPSQLDIIKSHIDDAIATAPPSYSAARMQSASATYNRRSSPM